MFNITPYLTLLLVAIFTVSGYGQLVDSFADGDFTTDPTWSGDTEDFIVNDQFRLQLQAADAGASILHTPVSYPDSLVISFDLELDFSPSTSNFGRVYFMLDSDDLNSASGYFLNFGSSGSTDAIDLYKLENGTETLLRQGTIGAIANSTHSYVELTLRNTNEWTLKAGYDTELLGVEFDVVDNSFSPSQGNTFLFYCQYTSSRRDLFFLDNLVVKEFEVDRIAPQLISAQILNESEVQVIFDERLDLASALNTANYSIDQGIGSPSAVMADNGNNNSFTLIYDIPFSETGEFFLSVSDIKDENQNVIEPSALSIFYARPPIVGDLYINEILSDPFTDGEDFIELYNASDDFIELNGLVVTNNDNQQSQSLTGNLQMPPKSYAAISSDIDALQQIYQLSDDLLLLQNNLPSMNNASGNCTIGLGSDVFDAIDYNEDMHNPLLNDTEGVSLEKILINQQTFTPENWTSSASSRLATPGLPNSNELTVVGEEEGFTAVKKLFSPNGDSNDDIFFLSYNLPSPGFVLNAKVMNSEGFEIVTLANNQLLASQGTISWDGRNETGILQNYGIYIIYLEYFNLEGVVKREKVVAVLGGNL